MNKIESAFKVIDKITEIILKIHANSESKPTLDQLKELIKRKKLEYIIKTKLRNLGDINLKL